MGKETIFGISGGNSFRDEAQMLKYYQNFDIDYIHTEKYWMDWMDWSLQDSHNCMRLKMPGSDNANYGVWKIIFEKYLAKSGSQNLSIVAHSLGTTFILKYLLENELKINKLHIVAPFVSDAFQPEEFYESTGSFEFNYKDINQIESKCNQICIWYSEDDEICTSDHAQYLHREFTNSELYELRDCGHFNQSTFWELVNKLRVNLSN